MFITHLTAVILIVNGNTKATALNKQVRIYELPIIHHYRYLSFTNDATAQQTSLSLLTFKK